MKKIVISSLLCFELLTAQTALPGDDYLIHADDKLTLIYTKDHEREAKEAKVFEDEVLHRYSKSYDFMLDSMLYVGLLSNHNQIANAFSTQFPLNLQMNYIGGSYMTDYMASTSWIKALLLHESAHNFQLNAKQNPLSRYSHQIIGNVPFTMLFFMPIFPVPNVLESNFMIEGNAVFNESRFGNGGRLYNGAHLAQAVTQAKAGNLTPEWLYNDHLFFPFNTHHYIVGGFFQYYLAKTYGVDTVNRYFWTFSSQYLPFQTNAMFKNVFGVSFERAVKDFENAMLLEFGDFQVSKGEEIARSKFHHALNGDTSHLYFLTSTAKSRSTLHCIDKNDGSMEKKRGYFFFGKVFEIAGTYYSSASSHVDTDKISLGLFDSGGTLYTPSDAKVVQQILSDGRLVYFDVNRSFDEPALFVGDRFYGHVNSSVFADADDHLYYFKQDGKKRTLYRDKTPLFSLQDWYGFVVDVNENGIYFIANSQNGSTLYSFDGTKINRLLQGDDIVDARLINSDTALITTIDARGYSYQKAKLLSLEDKPFERALFFEKRDDFAWENQAANELASNTYKSHEHMHYSALAHSFEYQDDRFDYYLGANFSDPLSQSNATLYLTSYDDAKIGAGYQNSANLLAYGFDLYVPLEETEQKRREFGANFSLSLPLYKSGYESIVSTLSYHLDHKEFEKEPLSFQTTYNDYRQYGIAMYPDFSHMLRVFGIRDRGDSAYGLGYGLGKSFIEDFYTDVMFTYAKSDATVSGERRGIKLSSSEGASYTDPSRIVMPTLRYTSYAKEVVKASLGANYALDFHWYAFSLPLSLRREALYANYSYYDVTFLSGSEYRFDEYRIGAKFDLLFFHKNEIPLRVEYMFNDDLSDPYHFRVLFDLPL